MGYKGADIILPIHRCGQTKDSYIIVQVKNRQNDVFGDALKRDSCGACKDAAGLMGPAVPHLGILMSMRSKNRVDKMEISYPFEKTFSSSSFSSSDRFTRQRKNKHQQEISRVILTSVGLSQKLFPGVAFPGGVGARETAIIFSYLRDLAKCNTEMATHKDIITSYYKRLASFELS